MGYPAWKGKAVLSDECRVILRKCESLCKWIALWVS